MGEGKEREIEVLNDIGARVGDRVTLYFASASLLKVTFLLYLFPVLSLFAGAVGGHWIASHWRLQATFVPAIAGFFGLIFSFAVVKRSAGRLEKKASYRPRIIGIR